MNQLRPGNTQTVWFKIREVFSKSTFKKKRSYIEQVFFYNESF